MTRKVSYFIMMFLWLISFFRVFLVTYYYPNLKVTLFMHIFLIMIWCVLCTASFVNGIIHTENGEFYVKMPQWKNMVALNTIESNKALKAYWSASHCVRSVRIRRFSGPNTGKYGPKKIRIRTFFMRCYVQVIWIWSNSWRSNLHIFTKRY